MSVTINGYLDLINCTKYINNKSDYSYGNNSYGYSYDAQVGYIDFLPAGIDVNGHCDYVMAIALSGPSYGSSSINLEWNGFSFSIGMGSPSGNMYKKGEYVIPNMLN